MKMMMLFRRKPGLTPDQFREYYEQKHVPLALKLFSYFKDYRRNYIRHDLNHQRAGGEVNTRLEFDVITEVTFENESDYHRLVREMTDPAIRDQVVEDEKRFMDRTATVVFLVDEAVTPLPSRT